MASKDSGALKVMMRSELSLMADEALIGTGGVTFIVREANAPSAVN
jgi:hypothetical protein